MKQLLKFILSHSLFVSLCAFGLTCQTYIINHRPINLSIAVLIFFSTVGAYNLYWIISKWLHNKNSPILFSHYRVNFMLLLFSFIAIIDFLWQMPHLLGLFCIAVVLTSIYTIIALPIFKIISVNANGLFKTFALASTWTFVTVIIPLHDSLFQSGLWLMVTNRFLFLLMLCIIFDARDSKLDSLLKMEVCIKKMNSKVLSVLMLIILLLNGLLLLLFGAVYQNQTQVFILLCSSALAFLLYLLSFKKRGYYFYYFLVDGLMLLSSFASYLATI